MNPLSTVIAPTVEVIGGSTALLEIGGLRFITDPTFDPPGSSTNGSPHRLSSPSKSVAELDPIDVALVSHDQHPDNLDQLGRELLAHIPLVLTTSEGASRLGSHTQGLEPWESVSVENGVGGELVITAVPAEHGPPGAAAQSGPVIGFVISGQHTPSVYVSGDNASLEVVKQVADRFAPIDIAVIFTGAASVGRLHNGAPLTLTGDQVAQAARILSAKKVIPIHCEGWSHYTEGVQHLREAFSHSQLGHVLINAPVGERVKL